MIAVAAALTLTALAIWAGRTMRRPIDWTGKLTRAHSASLGFAYDRIIAEAAREAASLGSRDPRPYEDKLITAINAHARVPIDRDAFLRHRSRATPPGVRPAETRELGRGHQR